MEEGPGSRDVEGAQTRTDPRRVIFDPDDDIREGLAAFGPKACGTLRRVLIRDQADRDAIASQLLRYRDGHGDDWADIIDMLTMYPDARRNVARILGEIDAS